MIPCCAERHGLDVDEIDDHGQKSAADIETLVALGFDRNSVLAAVKEASGNRALVATKLLLATSDRSRTNASGSSESQAQITCPQGHELTAEKARHHDCDICGKSIRKGNLMCSCRRCDFDTHPECVQSPMTASVSSDAGIAPSSTADSDSDSASASDSDSDSEEDDMKYCSTALSQSVDSYTYQFTSIHSWKEDPHEFSGWPLHDAVAMGNIESVRKLCATATGDVLYEVLGVRDGAKTDVEVEIGVLVCCIDASINQNTAICDNGAHPAGRWGRVLTKSRHFATVRWLDEIGSKGEIVPIQVSEAHPESCIGACVADLSDLILGRKTIVNGAAAACRERCSNNAIADNCIPLHIAALDRNASADLIDVLIELGGAETLDMRECVEAAGGTTSGGRYPIEMAADSNPCVTVFAALAEKWGLDKKDSKGRTALALASGSKFPTLHEWARGYGAVLGRYKQDPGPPLHLSTTSLTIAAEDICSPTVSPKYIGIREGAPHVSVHEGAIVSLNGRLGEAVTLYGQTRRYPDGTYGPFHSVHVKWLDDLTESDKPIPMDEFDAIVASRQDLEEDPQVRTLIDYRSKYPQGGRVVMKYMKHREQLEREIHARVVEKRGESTGYLSNRVVIGVRGWHLPRSDQGMTDIHGQHEEPERTDETAEYPYILIMQAGERSLHDACAKERIAGFDAKAIRDALLSVGMSICELHAHRIVHGDVKQRNVLRARTTGQWVLCDMDASSRVGDYTGHKTSSAYMPPELAKQRFGLRQDSSTIVAATSFDVWSFGVVLFELCAGRPLFAQDTANDELTSTSDRERLCVWLRISDEELEPVFSAFDGNESQMISDAKHLIRWCLCGNPDERPTMEQIVRHRFLCPTSPVPRPLRMLYFAFLSHSQADASGTVGTLYFAFKSFGLHTWLDMRQENLTLEGMRQGVHDATIFILVLTQHVLTSWFCQQEMLEAIKLKKPVQLVIEKEKRFSPFDLQAWQTSRHNEERSTSVGSTEEFAIPAQICNMIDEALPNAITYRRRDFEAEAMLRELCARNGLILPPRSTTPSMRCNSDDIAACSSDIRQILVIQNTATAGDMVATLRDAIATVMPIQLTENIRDANHVLLVLTPGILDSKSPQLKMLSETIQADLDSQRDRIIAVFDENGGWKFGCMEQLAAPHSVQACLNEHEAISYRPPQSAGPDRHEFAAMVGHIVSIITRTQYT